LHFGQRFQVCSPLGLNILRLSLVPVGVYEVVKRLK